MIFTVITAPYFSVYLSSSTSVRILLAGQAPVSGHLCPTPLVAAYENHSRKRPAPVTDTFFASQGFPLTRASTVEDFCFLPYYIDISVSLSKVEVLIGQQLSLE